MPYLSTIGGEMGKGNKSRTNKVKKLHHSIDGLYTLLDKIAEFNEVQAVIPLHIAPKAKAGRPLRFRISRTDTTGIRLICTSKGAAQPVQITCNELDRTLLVKKLQTLYEFDDGSSNGRRPRQKQRFANPPSPDDLLPLY